MSDPSNTLAGSAILPGATPTGNTARSVTVLTPASIGLARGAGPSGASTARGRAALDVCLVRPTPEETRVCPMTQPGVGLEQADPNSHPTSTQAGASQVGGIPSSPLSPEPNS